MSTVSNESIIADPPRRITKAVFIGINYVGTQSELRGCVSDVNKKFSRARMFYSPSSENTVVLTDDVRNLSPELSKVTLPRQPTRKNILDALNWLVANSKAGDLLYLHYSGHGSQERDKNGDEVDGKDECICPSDLDTNGMIIDDEIKAIVDGVPEGAYCLMEMDCCHSSSCADLMEVVTVAQQAPIKYQMPQLPPPPKIPSAPIQQYKPPQYKPQPQKIVMIGGVPYYMSLANPMFAGRELREYPCIVFKYFQDGVDVSRRSLEFRPTWDNIVNGFCVDNNVRAYEEITTESRCPTVHFYYSDDCCLTFKIPDEFRVLDKFLIDRNSVRSSSEQRSRGLLSSFHNYANQQISNYISSIHNLVHQTIYNTLRSNRDVNVGSQTYTIKTITKNTPTKGVVVVWTGCKDEQTSADSNIAGTPVGAMTHYHLQASSDNSKMRNIDVLCGERDLLGQNRYDQIPQLSFGHSGKKLIEAPYPLHLSRAQ